MKIVDGIPQFSEKYLMQIYNKANALQDIVKSEAVINENYYNWRMESIMCNFVIIAQNASNPNYFHNKPFERMSNLLKESIVSNVDYINEKHCK